MYYAQYNIIHYTITYYIYIYIYIYYYNMLYYDILE